jgi:predicted ATPase
MPSEIAFGNIYSFGPFTFDRKAGSLAEDGKPVRLGHRALEVLAVLVERAGDVVSNQELIARVWPDTFVDESNVRVHLASIRKALRDGKDQVRYILNIPGRGYRFVAPIACARTSSSDSGLPALLPPLVGRTKTISEITRALQAHRLVTIVGAGGIGKTSVALAIAHETAHSYQDGARFVDLGSVTHSDQIPSTILGVQTNLPGLMHALRDKKLLLILDNCEHLIDGVAELIEILLQRAPQLRIIATSREALRVETERVRRLSPLDAPPSGSAITSSEALAFPAVQLFVDRAAASADGFDITNSNTSVVASICNKLDGLPLAIELAAARVDTIGLAGLSDEVGSSASVLSYARRTVQARHRSLEASLDWSFNLLSEPEQCVLTRLSVLNSEFSREAACAVASDQLLSSQTILKSLVVLSAKSLIAARFHEGHDHYRLLNTTRLYAQQKLAQRTPIPLYGNSPQRALHNDLQLFTGTRRKLA